MASTVTLYNELTGAAISGVWTYSSGPASYPAAPGSYNGTIDFAGYGAGEYIYRYRVTDSGLEDVSFVTVVWAGDGDARLNESCTTAYNMGSYNVSPFAATTSDDSRGVCITGLLEPTISGLAIPSEWGGSTYGGDLFYKIRIPSCSIGYTVTVSVSNSGFDSPAKGFGLQIYTACRENDCDVVTRQTSAAGNMMQGTVSASIIIDSSSSQILYVRVVSQMLGQYNVNVSSDFECTNTEPGVCDAITKVMGWGPDLVIGYGPNFVFSA